MTLGDVGGKILMFILVVLAGCASFCVVKFVTQPYSMQITEGAQLFVSQNFPGKTGNVTCAISRGVSQPSVNIVPCVVNFGDGTQAEFECTKWKCGSQSLPVRLE